ncbi:MAG TPA: hypothetical protein VEQ60_24510, partial [Longimicrobium sp.]|nr:hypothetical protein [Longimicrobium sp.]
MPLIHRGRSLRLLAGAVLAPVALLVVAFAARANPAGPLASVLPVAFHPAERDGSHPAKGGTSASAAASMPVTVQLADLNSGETIERSQCVTVATGVRSAYECGDLRIVHPLPAFRTHNQVRAPVLLYNGQHAHPKPTVYANVTLPAGASVPTSVQASVVIAGATVATASWPGGDWAPGASRRVALQWDGLSTATGLYPYTLQVTASYSGTQVPSAVVVDTLAVVNRSSSAFGAGWWLSGMEELVPFGAGFLWVGGDGSTRSFVPDGTNRWTAFNPAGPRHELLRATNPATGVTYYHRKLQAGGEVVFDLAGKHVATTNRVGHSTWFTPSNGRLGSINLPVAGGGYPAYIFGYDAEGRVAHIEAAVQNGSSRVTYLGRFGAGDRRLAMIQDPDQLGVTFAYDPAVTRRISHYNDRRNTGTSFTYDAAGKISGTRLWMGSVASAADLLRGFEAGESKGVTSSVAVADVYTKLDGARTDVADHTLLWLTHRGAPSRIRDALGNETQILRESAVYPSLTTRTIAPNGYTQRAEYTGRGALRRLISVDPRGDGRTDTTTYVYQDNTWPDFPTTLIPPERDSITIAYRNDGSRAWQRDALGRTVYFRYYETGPHKGLLRATDTPETPADSLVYDGVLGNLSGTRSPLGVWTLHATDLIGQPTQVTGTIDAAGNQQHQYTFFDAMGRDTLVRATGPALPYT